MLVETGQSEHAVCGGGNTEVQMSIAVDDLAKKTSGKEALAIEAFARALRQLPTIICDNAGYDSAELVQTLVSEVYNGNDTSGINMNTGEIDNMKDNGVTECF